jgi:hypothetical protein
VGEQWRRTTPGRGPRGPYCKSQNGQSRRTVVFPKQGPGAGWGVLAGALGSVATRGTGTSAVWGAASEAGAASHASSPRRGYRGKPENCTKEAYRHHTSGPLISGESPDDCRDQLLSWLMASKVVRYQVHSYMAHCQVAAVLWWRDRINYAQVRSTVRVVAIDAHV